MNEYEIEVEINKFSAKHNIKASNIITAIDRAIYQTEQLMRLDGYKKLESIPKPYIININVLSSINYVDGD